MAEKNNKQNIISFRVDEKNLDKIEFLQQHYDLKNKTELFIKLIENEVNNLKIAQENKLDAEVIAEHLSEKMSDLLDDNIKKLLVRTGYINKRIHQLSNIANHILLFDNDRLFGREGNVVGMDEKIAPAFKFEDEKYKNMISHQKQKADDNYLKNNANKSNQNLESYFEI